MGKKKNVFLVGIVLVGASLILPALFTCAAKSEVGPIPGQEGIISVSNITKTSLTLSWAKAADDITPQSELEYRVYTSSSDNIDTDADVEPNGSAVSEWQADLNTLDVTGLTAATPYYFNVLVRDAQNNTAAYTMVTATPDGTNPTVSVTNIRDQGKIHSGFVTGTAGDNVSVAQVEVSLDGGSYENADLSSDGADSVSWSYQLPTGTNIWKYGSEHMLEIRSRDGAGKYSAVTSVTVRKGKNQDVNGDGYADLAVGALGHNSYTGKVYIYRGSSSGIPADYAQDLNGENEDDRFGVSYDFGDVNGDGYADLAVGSSTFNSDTGRVYIHYGSNTGIEETAARVLTGETIVSRFGSSVALGDSDRDGYDDLAVGATFLSGEGRVYVYPGGSSGIPSDFSQTIYGDAVSAQSFGGSAAMGDANGDGYADLAVGAVGYDYGEGWTYVFHGGESGISGSYSRLLAPGLSTVKFGYALAFGDVNGDGYDDLGIGDYIFNSHWGKAYIYHGGSSGIPDTESWSIHLAGSEDVYHLGQSVALGDVNGDGYADFAIGAPSYTTQSHIGWAFVYYGSEAGITEDPPETFECENTGDYYGSSVAIGDADNDGYADLVIGARGYSSFIGRVYVHHGNSSGVSTTASRTLDGENSSDTFGSTAVF